jgi:hypothetical protein
MVWHHTTGILIASIIGIVIKEINNNSSCTIPLSNVFLCWCVSDAKLTIRAVVVATFGCVEGISSSAVYTKVDSS